jgi:hypothetical protein
MRTDPSGENPIFSRASEPVDRDCGFRAHSGEVGRRSAHGADALKVPSGGDAQRAWPTVKRRPVLCLLSSAPRATP